MTERKERQDLILARLRESSQAVRGEDLANRCHVTRQVIVHEIALLKAQGISIVSTPRGYFLNTPPNGMQETVISVRHVAEQTEDELYIFVDHGVAVETVIVEHPIYGTLQGALHLSSRRDVMEFIEALKRGHVALLSSLTQGYHLHGVSYRKLSHLDDAIQALMAKNIEAHR